MAQWLDAKVTRRIDWNDHLFSLVFQCADFPSYKAGQFTKVGMLDSEDKVLSRPYSLVSNPQDNELEIIAVPVEEGALSPKLHKVSEGDSLKVLSPATGFLVLDEVPESEVLWLVATGTGVGPFLSIMQTEQPWQSYKKVILVYAVRHINDMAYMPLIESLQEKYPGQLTFVPIVSREQKEGYLKGRIPSLLENHHIQERAGCGLHPDNSQVMLCGNPDMIAQTMSILEGFGLKKHLRRSPGQISMERYW